MLLIVFKNFAQQTPSRVITTAVPFLNIAADARSSGMGDIGVATAPDVYSQQWNPAKYVFAEETSGIGISYTPYLSSIADNVALLQANYYHQLNDRSAFSAGIRYFGFGEVPLRLSTDDPGRVVKPNEFTVEGSYSLKLSDQFSMAVGGKYINSNLKIQEIDPDAQSAGTIAIDIAGYYQSKLLSHNSFNGRWRLGFNISNIGPKIKYDEGGQKNFLPTNLKFGGGYDFIFDRDNTLAFNVEFNKLLVPTPKDFDGDGDIDAQDNAAYADIGFFSGMFKSLGDAPDGFSEELKEITWALGAEYTYQGTFSLRTGYFNESEDKGSRQFFTLGGGFRYKAAIIDLSYLFSTSSVNNPLEDSLRFSLSFNLGSKRR